MNTTRFSNPVTITSMAAQLSNKSEVVTNTSEMQGRKRSALIQALALRCNESDESSDETESTTTTASDDEEEEEEYVHHARFPSTFGRNQHERHFSNISEKRTLSSTTKEKPLPAPLKLSSSTHSTITPSIEVEQVFDEEETGGSIVQRRISQTDARMAARAKMMQTIGKNRLTSLRRSESLDVLIGQSPDEKKQHASTPAIIVDGEKTPSPSTTINLATTPLPRTPGTAALRTPGTAYHHRSFSCPTPNSPMLHQFGQFQVMVTPPTPRPQSSPVIGVFIKGVHDRHQNTAFSSKNDGVNNTGRQHFCAFDDQCSRLGRCRKELKLAVPEFELAPGRTKLLEAQRIQAMAIMAWKQQEDLMMNWGTLMNEKDQDALPDSFNNHHQFSPVLLPGTPCAPSLTHVQEVRAMQSRHMVRHSAVNEKPLPSPPNSTMTVSTTNATDGGEGRRSPNSTPDSLSASSSSSWWREPRSAPLSWNGSSASAYSQASAMSSNMMTNGVSPAVSEGIHSASPISALAMITTMRKDNADASPNWRSKESKSTTTKSYDEPSLANNGLSRSKHPYVPPAMRNASRLGNNNNELRGRKEGAIGLTRSGTSSTTMTFSKESAGGVVKSAPNVRTLVVPSTTTNESTLTDQHSLRRQHAAKSMLSRLSNRTAANATQA